MAGLSKANFRGKEVIVVDYRGQSDDEMHETLEAMRQLVLQENKFNLRLVYAIDVSPSARFRTNLRKVGQEIGHIPSKVAIIGVPAMQKVLMNAYNKLVGGNMRLFDTEEEALDYLLQ